MNHPVQLQQCTSIVTGGGYIYIWLSQIYNIMYIRSNDDKLLMARRIDVRCNIIKHGTYYTYIIIWQ